MTLWTIARQAPLSTGFSRQEYWSGLPCPPPGDLPDPGTEPVFLNLLHGQAGSLPLVPLGKPRALGSHYQMMTVDMRKEICLQSLSDFKTKVQRVVINVASSKLSLSDSRAGTFTTPHKSTSLAPICKDSVWPGFGLAVAISSE